MLKIDQLFLNLSVEQKKIFKSPYRWLCSSGQSVYNCLNANLFNSWRLQRRPETRILQRGERAQRLQPPDEETPQLAQVHHNEGEQTAPLPAVRSGTRHGDGQDGTEDTGCPRRTEGFTRPLRRAITPRPRFLRCHEKRQVKIFHLISKILI